MSFKCMLKVDDKEFRVLSFDVSFDRPVDNFKRPAGEVRGCFIHCTIETTSDTSLFSWFANQFQTRKCLFTFSQRDSEQRMREMEFTTAYLVNYRESFQADGSDPFLIEMGISCNDVRIQNVMMASFWPQEF